MIPQELKMIFDDAQFWLDNDTYTFREIAIRLHHRLVFVHPFPNGNGRCSRLFADLFMHCFGGKGFTWGSDSLIEDSKTRREYLIALREADKGEYQKLIEFADS
jgi:Fic-DOC domain mobile mystery protein B